jgi:hypothetical protein
MSQSACELLSLLSAALPSWFVDVECPASCNSQAKPAGQAEVDNAMPGQVACSSFEPEMASEATHVPHGSNTQLAEDSTSDDAQEGAFEARGPPEAVC